MMMIPNRAQFMIHGMLSLSLNLSTPTNQTASSHKTRRDNDFPRRPKSLPLNLRSLRENQKCCYTYIP